MTICVRKPAFCRLLSLSHPSRPPKTVLKNNLKVILLILTSVEAKNAQSIYV